MTRTVDAIARTPEYRRFIQDLEAFHQKHGTTLQAEPILGGQKLDLLKLFQVIMTAGGYDQVTKDRAWKQLGDSFHFKATCTNSAYVLKAIYKKNLLGWEQTTIWKQRWDPLQISDLQKQYKDDTRRKSRDRDGKHDFKKKKKSIKIKDPRKVGQNDSSADIGVSHLSSSENMDQLDAFLRQLPTMLEEAGQVSAPEKLVSYTQLIPKKDVHPTAQLSMIPSMLMSKKPSDVHSAMLYLLKRSFESPETIADIYVEPIVDALIPFAQSMLFDPALRQTQTDQSMDVDVELAECQTDADPISHTVDSRLTFDAFRILRNLSFVEADAQLLATKPVIRKMILRGLTLPTSSKFVELTEHSLDILDNISTHVKVPENDEYISSLLQLLSSNDREVIIGVLKALACLIIQHTSNYAFLASNNEPVKRLIQLLLVDDEDLVTRTLEFLYVYTSAWPEFTTQLLGMYPGNGISLLTSFLTYESKKPSEDVVTPLSQSSKAQNVCHDPDCDIPNLTHYQDMDEPYRCLGWLKQKFDTSNSDGRLTLSDLYLLYETRFGMERPLDLEKFAVVFKIAYPNVTITGGEVTTTPADQIIVHGIQIKLTILDDAEEFVCKWSNCARTFPDELHLQHHVFSDHVPPYPSGPYQCHWMQCSDIPDGESNTRDSIASHLGTHFSEDEHFLIHNHHSSNHQGIPLATALLLHNFARQKHNSSYFEPYTNNLQNMVEQKPHLAEIIQNILHELEI